MLKPFQSVEECVEHDGDGDANYIRSTWNCPQKS